MAKPQIRFFQTEKQKAQLADVLVSIGKQKGQEAKDQVEYVFDKLTEAAVQGSIGINSMYDEGKITLGNGAVFKIKASDLEAEAKAMKSDPDWTPEREGAKLRIITLGESSLLYASLIKCAALENSVTKKITGETAPKYPCLEAYVDNILNGHLRNDTAQNLLKELQAEKRETFAEKKPEEQAKDGKKKADQVDKPAA